MKKENILNIIEHYRKIYETKNTKPGWTSWVLVVTIAAISWNIIGNIKENVLTIESILINASIFILVFELITSIYSIFSSLTEDRSSKNFPLFKDLINKRIRVLIFHLFKYVIICLIFNGYKIFENPYNFLINIYLGLTIFSIIGAFFMRATRFPIDFSNYRKNYTQLIFSAVIYIIQIISIYSIIDFNKISNINYLYQYIPIFVLYILINEYVKQFSVNVDKYFFENLYNEVLFSEDFNEQKIIKRIETVVLGHTASDIAFLFVEDFENLLIEITIKSEDLKKTIVINSQESDPFKKQIYAKTIEGIKLEIRTDMRKLKYLLKKIEYSTKILEKMKVKETIISEINLRLKSDFNDLLVNLEKNIDYIE